jgi:hypothetical protein
MNKVEIFLKQLRESADIIYKIYTDGSCYKLYEILKVFYPDAIPYWSDRDNHCLVKIKDSFYDIGGIINKEWVEEKGYYPIPENQKHGYSLLKYSSVKEEQSSIVVEKYITKTNEQSTKN